MTPTRPSHTLAFIGAHSAVLDPIEAIFAKLPNHAILRSALCRLFHWMKDRGTPVISSGEMGATPG